MFDILEEPEMIALYGNSTENFKASFRWLTLFMKKHKLSYVDVRKSPKNF